MDVEELYMTALRATIIYFSALFVIRVLGKREVGNITAFDFLVGLMLGEVVDEAIFGDVSLLQGGLAILTIAFWHFVNSWGSYKSQLIHDLTSAAPTVLVEAGKIQRDAMAKERMNEAELWAELRMQSIDQLEEVQTATLEPTGQVSVLKQEWAKTLQKKDLPKFQEKDA